MRRLAGNVLVLALALLASVLPVTTEAAQATTGTFEAVPWSLGPIPDNQPSCSSTRVVEFNVEGLTGSITAVSVSFTLDPAHTWVGDLAVDLLFQSPGGLISHAIFGQPPAGSDLAGPYVFSDAAPESPTWWEAAGATNDSTAVPAGSYRASVPGGQPGEGNNTLITPSFAGLEDANGEWFLRFCDPVPGDTGTVSAAALTLTADAYDQPPVAVDDEATVAQGAAETFIDVLANDSDPDGGPMYVVGIPSEPANGSARIVSDVGVMYQPEPHYCNEGSATDDFSYALNRGSIATVSVTVTCPEGSETSGSFPANASTLGSFQNRPSLCPGNAHDVTFDANGLAGSITDVSVRFKLAPVHPQLEYLAVSIQAPDDTVSHPLFDRTREGLNPQGGPHVGGPYLFSDSAPESPTWWEAAASAQVPPGSYRTSVPGGQVGAGANTLMSPSFTGVQDPNGTWTLRFCDRSFLDWGAAVSFATLYLSTELDQAPVAVDDEATVAQGAAATAIDVLANDTDVDGGPMVVESVTQPSNGSVLITDSGTGVTYEPDAGTCNDGSPTDDFTYTLNGGSTATVAMTVTCGAVFEALPVTLGPIPDGCQEGRDVKFNVSGLAGTITDVAVSFTLDPAHTYVGDLDVQLFPPDGVSSHPIFSGTSRGVGEGADAGGPYTFSDSAPSSPTWWEAAAATNSNSVIPAGSYRASVPAGQPGQGQNALITPSFHGVPTANGQWTLGFCDTELADTGTVSAATLYLTTDPGDQPPVAVDDEATVDKGAPATPIDVLSNDTDADGGPMTIASATQPTSGVVVIGGSRSSLTYQPAADHCNDGDPTDDFTYSLNGGSTATVSVTVVCVDQPPVAFDDFADGQQHPAAVQNGGPVQIDVLTNDTDTDGGPMFIDGVTQPSNGTVVVPSGGQHLTYEPNPNYCNDPGGPPDDFTYTLNGGSTATVLVTVICLSVPPDDVTSTLTLKYSAKKKLFKGALSSEHPDCVGGRIVTIWKEAKNGPAIQIGQTTAAADGSYLMKKKVRKGGYHATVETDPGPGGADCLGAKSPTKRVR